MQHLQNEGLSESSHLVGDVMIDVLNTAKESVSINGRSSEEIDAPEGQFYLATIHRQENTDIEDRLREIIDSLLDFSDRPIKEIMTPRVDVLFLSLPIEINDIKKIVKQTLNHEK